MLPLLLLVALAAVPRGLRPALGAQLNRAPQFLPAGSMSRFSLPEDTPVGAPVYRLQGADPEGSAVRFSISGEHFTVDKNSGVVSLRKPLDRETQDLLEVIISITGNPLRHYLQRSRILTEQRNYNAVFPYVNSLFRQNPGESPS